MSLRSLLRYKHGNEVRLSERFSFWHMTFSFNVKLRVRNLKEIKFDYCLLGETDLIFRKIVITFW